jgi:glycosyltransferase involved in cell wall biosynthesis
MPFTNLKGIYYNLKWVLLYPLSCLNLFRCLLNASYDIVHFNSASLIVYGWIPKLFGVKLVCHIREPLAQGTFGLRRLILRKFLFLLTDKCIAICEDNARDTKLSNNQCKVIYNPIDFNKFDKSKKSKREFMEELDIPKGSFVTLFAGGSNSNAKGLSDFILVMNEVRQKIQNLVCLMPSFDITLIQDEALIPIFNRLKKHVIQKPFVANIESWIGASDIVYALHKVPHFSRTLVEAGAMEKPVIAYDIGGINEIINHRKNGLLCPINDVESVVKATENLYEDNNLSKEISKSGYRHSINHFDANVHSEAVLKIYKSLLM